MSKISKLVFLSAGAGLAWFLDPVSGAARRRQLQDQVSGLTGGGGGTPGFSDPTGGAVPFTPAPTPPPAIPADPDLVRAVEDVADETRATLRTSW